MCIRDRLKTNPIDVPGALVDMEIERLMQNARQDMEQRGGAKMKDFPMQREWFVDQAKRRVSLGLIPVSYTHLDVYKRQRSTFGNWFRAWV